MENQKDKLSIEQERFAMWYKRFVRGKQELSDEQDSKLQAECEKTAELITEYGIDSLHEGDKCVLCADRENAHECDCYATTDLGHSQPEERDSEAMKVKSGSAIPVTFTCCKTCKRNYMLCELVPTALGALIVIATLILMSRRIIREWLLGLDFFVPVSVRLIVIFVIILIIAIYATVLLRNYMIKKLSKQTHLSVFKLPLLSLMKRQGWFSLYDSKYVTRMVFTNTLPEYLEDKQEELPQQEPDEADSMPQQESDDSHSDDDGE